MMRRPIALPLLTVALLHLGRLLASSAATSESLVPRVEVDPFWPKPLPNNWLMGQAAGVATDRRDHVWVIQRPKSLTEDERGATLSPPRSLCCAPAPPVLEFAQDGTLFVHGAGRATDTIGRRTSMASISIRKASHGSLPMASRMGRS